MKIPYKLVRGTYETRCPYGIKTGDNIASVNGVYCSFRCKHREDAFGKNSSIVECNHPDTDSLEDNSIFSMLD